MSHLAFETEANRGPRFKSRADRPTQRTKGIAMTYLPSERCPGGLRTGHQQQRRRQRQWNWWRGPGNGGNKGRSGKQ